MNATMLTKRTGMLFAVAAASMFPVIAGSAQPSKQVQTLALGTQQPAAVVDSTAAAPIEWLLFVHRPDLPLRALPIKQKDHS